MTKTWLFSLGQDKNNRMFQTMRAQPTMPLPSTPQFQLFNTAWNQNGTNQTIVDVRLLTSNQLFVVACSCCSWRLYDSLNFLEDRQLNYSFGFNNFKMRGVFGSRVCLFILIGILSLATAQDPFGDVLSSNSELWSTFQEEWVLLWFTLTSVDIIIIGPIT